MCGHCSGSKSAGAPPQVTKGQAATHGPVINPPPVPHPFAMAKSGDGGFPTPTFKEEFVQQGRCDGYWIEPILLDPSDKAPGLIAYDSGIVTVLESLITNMLHLETAFILEISQFLSIQLITGMRPLSRLLVTTQERTANQLRPMMAQNGFR